jgi:hypothetical protein
VREAKGEQAAQLIEDLKKADMAREAERLLDGTGWLPEPLRLRVADASESPDALPAFLADDSTTRSLEISLLRCRMRTIRHSHENLRLSAWMRCWSRTWAGPYTWLIASPNTLVFSLDRPRR